MSAQVDSVLAALVGHTARAMTVLAVELVAALQERNPVDTGWSRANWITTINTAFDAVFGTHDVVDVGAVQDALDAVVATYRVDLGPIHVSNHVPYVRAIGLSPGSSPQAPDGFVEDAIAAALARARLVLEAAP